MYENPSAGKFDPPPPPGPAEASGPSTKGWLRLWPLVLTILSIAPLVLGASARGRGGWLGGAAGVLLFAAGVAEYMLERARQDARENGPAPYSERTSITR